MKYLYFATSVSFLTTGVMYLTKGAKEPSARVMAGVSAVLAIACAVGEWLA